MKSKLLKVLAMAVALSTAAVGFAACDEKNDNEKDVSTDGNYEDVNGEESTEDVKGEDVTEEVFEAVVEEAQKYTNYSMSIDYLELPKGQEERLSVPFTSKVDGNKYYSSPCMVHVSGNSADPSDYDREHYDLFLVTHDDTFVIEEYYKSYSDNNGWASVVKKDWGKSTKTFQTQDEYNEYKSNMIVNVLSIDAMLTGTFMTKLDGEEFTMSQLYEHFEYNKQTGMLEANLYWKMPYATMPCEYALKFNDGLLTTIIMRYGSPTETPGEYEYTKLKINVTDVGKTSVTVPQTNVDLGPDFSLFH